jgi:hypothetical protein
MVKSSSQNNLDKVYPLRPPNLPMFSHVGLSGSYVVNRVGDKEVFLER